MVGYNVQAAVDAQHHLIVAHEVTNQGHDRSQLANMTAQARAATGTKDLRVLADRGYFSGEEILACEQTGATPFVPKPLSSGAKAEEELSKSGFLHLPEENVYRCPAGQTSPWHMTTIENEMPLHRYWDLASCRACAIRGRCTPSPSRRVARWEHEAIIDAMQQRLNREPHAMRTRRQTVEHVSGTLKAWTGATHFKTRRLKNVAIKLSLHALAYNLKCAIALLGVRPLISVLQA